MKYDINWFANNIVAIPTQAFGNCSACCFRNLDKEVFCRKLQCIDEHSGVCVYWDTKVPGRAREILMGQPSKEMVRWFTGTPFGRVQKITSIIINKALQKQKQNVK